MGIWRSLAGMVSVRITSADVGDALTAVNDSGIPLFRTEAVGDLSVACSIYRRDWRKLRKLLQRRGDRVELLQRTGLYWSFKNLLRRPVLLAGIVLLLAGAIYIPNHIFFIRVEGCDTTPERLILERASECGIRFGASRREVRSERMKNALLGAVPELEWAGVNTAGCVATITVRERTVDDSDAQTGAVGGIVAVRDGIIRECTVLSGNALCRVGQAVRAGELLVSGFTDFGICIRATPAKAEIYADTSRAYFAVTPANYTKRGEELRSERKFSLIFGKKRINLFKGSGISDATCVKMSDVRYLTLPGGFVLPVALVTETYTWYESEETELDAAAAEEQLSFAAADGITGQMIAGQIIGKKETVTRAEDLYCLTGVYACYEMIGRARNWENMDSYGKSN